jgi:hypothetical protein
MERRMTQAFEVCHLCVHLRCFAFFRHSIQRFLDFARNDNRPAREMRNDQAARCRSSSHAVLMFFVRQTWSKSAEINHEGREGHKEFAINRVTRLTTKI